MPTTGSPLGSPLGLGARPVAPAASPPTGLTRLLDPTTGDYSLDASTGRFAQTTPLRQRIVIIATTLRGSSTVLRELGLSRGGKLDASAEVRFRADVRRAFRQLTDVERVMRITSIPVERASWGRLVAEIVYDDLTTGDTNQRARL